MVAQTYPDPRELPEWRALHREASLVSQLIGAGVTALGKANYADHLGDYYTAFFGLSIGIERLAKLILVANFAIENAGALPGPRVVRDFGHDLKKLCDNSNQISIKYKLSQNYPKPKSLICWKVLECLASFADASQGRYANFQLIGNPSSDASVEPIHKWWSEVVSVVLAKHYNGSASEQRVKQRAAAFDALMGQHAYISHTSETGQFLTDIATSSERTGQTLYAQKFGRFYTLCIVRWLAEIFSKLAQHANHRQHLHAFFGHHEIFYGYCVPDHYLLKRKVWPLA